jgi:serine/threonine protein kinase
VITVEALTGRRPFSGKTYHELLNSILNKAFHLESEVPEVVRLDEVLQKCLAKDPRDRFTSAAEMQSELIPAIDQCPVLASHLQVGPDADTAILG